MLTNSITGWRKIAASLLIATMAITGAISLTGTNQASALTAADLQGGSGADSFGNSVGLGDADLKTGIGSIINLALGFLGIIAVIIVLYGGFKWMTASGDPTKVEKAQKVIVQGIIGLAIILSAWAITKFAISNVFTATGGGVTESSSSADELDE